MSKVLEEVKSPFSVELINKFKNIITAKNIREELENKENLELLIKIVPEINNMIGFKHNHPHHHLDVWNHTILAMENSNYDYDIRISLLLHDIGKPYSYQDEEIRHFRNHANMSEIISKNILERLGENPDLIKTICFYVKNHDSIIDFDNVKDEDLNIYLNLLEIQYCDAKAHHPDKVEKRIGILNDIKEKLYSRIQNVKLELNENQQF